MTQAKRLFDCLDYQKSTLPLECMLSSKNGGVWKAYSTNDVIDIINRLSAGLLKMGIGAGDGSDEGTDKIGIISNNRPEWLFTDMAVQQTGAVLVPVYPTTNPNELQFIFNDAAIKILFVSSKELYDKVKAIHPYVPSLQEIYVFDEIPGVSHWSQLSDLATPDWLNKLEQVKCQISETALATIIYTSGTTGTPKGVMLTHKNIVSCVKLGIKSFPFETLPGRKALSFLPLNHIFEKAMSYIYLFSGVSIYYAETLDTIGDNLREIKPQVFSTVPRLLEKVYEKIMTAGQQLTGVKRKLFFWSVSLAEKYDGPRYGSPLYKLQLALANKLVFSKWRQALGGNVECIITGGAAAPIKLLRIFNAAGIPVFEGYGPTENSPVITINRLKPEGLQKLGTVGPVMDGIEVKLAPDGEICVKGVTVMKGYYKRPDLTAETIIDGWLHTGDIGVFEENKLHPDKKLLRITDRKKELFKTSGGKYVAPQPIENKLKESQFIEQVIVVGAERKFVGALIVPAFAHLKSWMSVKGYPFTTVEDAIKLPEVLKKYKDVVEDANQHFNHVEQIKKFELLSSEWSIDSGEMTPKMSLKRKIIMEKYKSAIDRIYQ
jgi:long-chain acyl-CoA synthetase